MPTLGNVPYTILSHTADTGVEATAGTLAGLIGELARGMFALMAVVDPCSPDQSASFVVEADRPEDLVYDVLSELLFRFEVDGILFCAFSVKQPAPDRMEVTAAGAPAGEIELHGPPIKAVTFHDLTVTRQAAEQGGEVWFGRVYFDV